jgi:hypothetical protein
MAYECLITLRSRMAQMRRNRLLVGYGRASGPLEQFILDVPPGTSCSRIWQGEDGAGHRDAAQHVFAERYQRCGGLGSNRARDQHRTAEWPAQPLQPTDEIDRRADRGEVQPINRADISPQYLAEMQRRAEGKRRQALSLPHHIEMGHPGAGSDDRTQRCLAGLRRRAGDRENCQHVPRRNAPPCTRAALRRPR